jgi:hypothetical protein
VSAGVTNTVRRIVCTVAAEPDHARTPARYLDRQRGACAGSVLVDPASTTNRPAGLGICAPSWRTDAENRHATHDALAVNQEAAR